MRKGKKTGKYYGGGREKQAQCKRGHAYEGAVDKHGNNICRPCKRLATRRYREKKFPWYALRPHNAPEGRPKSSDPGSKAFWERAGMLKNLYKEKD